MGDTHFWTVVAAVGQVLGATATFAAVVVSLWIALSERRPRLLIRVGERLILGVGDQQRVVMFSVANVGQRAVHIRSIGWVTGRWPWQHPRWLARQAAVQIPGALGIGRDPPYELQPGQEISTYVDLDNFIERIRERAAQPLFARRWPVLGVRPTTVWGYAYIAEGVSKRAKIEKSLRQILAAAEREMGAPSRRAAEPV